MSDVGLLRKHSHLATSAFAENNRLFTEFKGALTENFVLQSLSRQFETAPRYWTETPYEVDFVVQLDNDIIPVGVQGWNERQGNEPEKILAAVPGADYDHGEIFTDESVV